MTRAVPYLLAAAALLTSCRSVTAPAGNPSSPLVAPRSADVRDDAVRARLRPLTALASAEEAQVPVVVRMESVADARGVHFRLHLAPEQQGDDPFYGPRTPGGWQFQLFMNADGEASTGYWRGYDYLTRDSEPELAAGTAVLRLTEGGGGPGGWGEAVTTVPVRVNRRLVMFTIPLEAIHSDGVVSFCIEMYATVAGGPDGRTPVARYVRAYEGTSAPRPFRDQDPSDPPIASAASPGGGGGFEPAASLERLISR